MQTISKKSKPITIVNVKLVADDNNILLNPHEKNVQFLEDFVKYLLEKKNFFSKRKYEKIFRNMICQIEANLTCVKLFLRRTITIFVDDKTYTKNVNIKLICVQTTLDNKIIIIPCSIKPKNDFNLSGACLYVNKYQMKISDEQITIQNCINCINAILSQISMLDKCIFEK